MLQITSLRSFMLLSTFACASVATACDNAQEPLVQFPSKQVLQASLREAGFDHFMEKTKIENIVGDQLVALEVAMRLEQKLYDYLQYMQQDGQNVQQARMIAIMMQMRKPQILEILLQKDPAALEELKKHGLYQPKK